ncbi:hypothetical protein IHC92_20800 [Photobacterium damselae subsp. damselae]|uniref:hypothetical protein n=1 Tax=Photobacterium damselae TaxID=38293 RepID=UPI001F2A30EB|nr:hypothetical protein [Photobacterium damselae]UKA23394.1 hypothetical protein IHC92_20800 [Photobacterium damselae subsp. damselae]
MAWTTNGYVPDDFNTVMDHYYKAFISQEGYETLTRSRFDASAEYTVFYASAQIDMSIQSMFAQTFEKVIDYLTKINLKIQQPATIPDAISESFMRNLGLDAKCKPMTLENRGKSHIAIDYEPNADANYSIAELLKKHIVDGIVTVGDITQKVTFSNGTEGSFSWTRATIQKTLFRITIQKSRNSTYAVDTAERIIKKFNDNYERLYSMGLDIEPERYFEVERDAPYASDILTEYSFDGGSSWHSTPFKSEFNIKCVQELKPQNIIVK